MKNGKRPTLQQKKLMRSHGLVPENWLVVKNTQEFLEVVSRTSLKKIGGKPKIRKLAREQEGTALKKSEYISCFLDFMRESTMEYEVARSRQSDADNETQDLLHRLELHDDTYHDMARISRELKKVRQERRKAKDTVAELEPVCKWREENARALKSLEQLLGAVRKAEKATQNRIYMDRTDAVRKAVKNEKEK